MASQAMCPPRTGCHAGDCNGFVNRLRGTKDTVFQHVLVGRTSQQGHTVSQGFAPQPCKDLSFPGVSLCCHGPTSWKSSIKDGFFSANSGEVRSHPTTHPATQPPVKQPVEPVSFGVHPAADNSVAGLQ